MRHAPHGVTIEGATWKHRDESHLRHSAHLALSTHRVTVDVQSLRRQQNFFADDRRKKIAIIRLNDLAMIGAILSSSRRGVPLATVRPVLMCPSLQSDREFREALGLNRSWLRTGNEAERIFSALMECPSLSRRTAERGNELGTHVGSKRRNS
jgi:hypothetical protein